MQVEQIRYGDDTTGTTLPLTTSGRVSVVVTCYNQSEYLAEAVESALAQDEVEVIVVDDGSTDATAAVAARYKCVRYIHLPNRGLSSARNTGLHASTGEYVIFLDADDRLLPGAANAGLDCFSAHPEALCVFGAHRRIDADGAPLEVVRHGMRGSVPYAALLQGNRIGMHAAAMYRRSALLETGGFDPDLPACEDYELFLRLARRAPLRAHSRSVADYRIHGANMSGDARLMLSTVTSVLRSQRPFVARDPLLQNALADGLNNWKAYYGRKLAPKGLAPARLRERAGDLPFLLRHAPLFLCKHIVRTAARAVIRRTRRIYQNMAASENEHRLRSNIQRHGRGAIDLGDLRRTDPVSPNFGYDRGTPVDRYYIERFLSRETSRIRGRVLEIGDDTYTRRFGGPNVTRRDVLHVEAGHRHATLSGDLTCADHIPSETFDCVILTQTLQFIYDVSAAVRTVHRILKPGGTVLATVPGISPVPRDQWGERCCWSFTTVSTRRLFEEVFGPDHVSTASHGNVLAATAFLQGLAAEEFSAEELDAHDASFQVVVTVRATRRKA